MKDEDVKELHKITLDDIECGKDGLERVLNEKGLYQLTQRMYLVDHVVKGDIKDSAARELLSRRFEDRTGIPIVKLANVSSVVSAFSLALRTTSVDVETHCDFL